MDPSIILCRYENSFDKHGATPIVLHTYKAPTKLGNTTVRNTNKQNSTSGTIDNIFWDQKLADNHGTLDTSMIHLTDPFHNVSYSPFINRDALVLANLDMTFNFSDHNTGYLLKQEIKDFSFVTFDDGPGGFAQYLFYRNPDAYGSSISPIRLGLPDKAIDRNRFNVIKGESGKGILRKDYVSMAKQIQKLEPTGVDVVAGNEIQPMESLDYLLRLLTTLKIIKIGGTFVTILPKFDNLLVDLLYITSLCFEEVSLIQPLSLPFKFPSNSIFLVAKRANTNNLDWIKYLEDSYSKNATNVSRVLDSVPKDFTDWIKEFNNLLLLYSQYLTDQKNKNKKILYDTYKCKAIWNLPQI